MSVYKYHALFDRANEPEKSVVSPKLTIGIPRVLNMYEEFPFWHSFFTNCGIRVVLSRPSLFLDYEKSVHSVMSDNICFPAKLVHSHIYGLAANKDVDRIFFQRVVYERREDKSVTGSFNCPIIIGYPEVVASVIKTSKPVDSPVVSLRMTNCCSSSWSAIWRRLASTPRR